ncbi:DUF3892 domain-containing protein [Planctomycetota bacterium]
MTCTEKSGVEVTALGNPEQEWSPRDKADVIQDIKSGGCTYFAQFGGKNVEVQVVTNMSGTKICTDPGKTLANRLLELPDL